MKEIKCRHESKTCGSAAQAQRLGVAVTQAATMFTPLAEEPAPLTPLFAHDGTERRIIRPQDPTEQTDCYSGLKKDHTVKNVLLVNAPLTILFLSDTYGGRVHDKRIAQTTPYPLPAESRLLQDLGIRSVDASTGGHPDAD